MSRMVMLLCAIFCVSPSDCDLLTRLRGNRVAYLENLCYSGLTPNNYYCQSLEFKLDTQLNKLINIKKQIPERKTEDEFAKG